MMPLIKGFIILATGRPFSGIKPYLDELGLKCKDQFCISNNGSVIHDALTGQHLMEFPLSFNDYLTIEQSPKFDRLMVRLWSRVLSGK